MLQNCSFPEKGYEMNTMLFGKNKLVMCRITRTALYNLGFKMDGVLWQIRDFKYYSVLGMKPFGRRIWMFMLCNLKDRKRFSMWKWLAGNPVTDSVIIQLDINQEMSCGVLMAINYFFRKKKKSCLEQRKIELNSLSLVCSGTGCILSPCGMHPAELRANQCQETRRKVSKPNPDTTAQRTQ